MPSFKVADEGDVHCNAGFADDEHAHEEKDGGKASSGGRGSDGTGNDAHDTDDDGRYLHFNIAVLNP